MKFSRLGNWHELTGGCREHKSYIHHAYRANQKRQSDPRRSRELRRFVSPVHSDQRLSRPHRPISGLAEIWISDTFGFAHSIPLLLARVRSRAIHSLTAFDKQSFKGQPGAVSIRWRRVQANPKQLSGPKSDTNWRASASSMGEVMARSAFSNSFSCSTVASRSSGSGPSRASVSISGRIPMFKWQRIKVSDTSILVRRTSTC